MGKLSSLLAGAMKSKSTKRKEEYAKYRNTFLSNPKHEAKKMQSYAQWLHDKYGKYEKPKAVPVKRAESKPSVSKTTRTKAIHEGLKESGTDWEKDRPSQRFKRSRKSK